jgi:cellulose synthase/poly-beta-1,6-N-acetylglucosamine synthase-like glycosyltransferase
MNLLTLVSGAFGLYRRQVLVEVGGLSTDTVGEDFELIMKIHRYMLKRRKDYRIEFLPEPVCWTEVPEDLRSLSRQRSRWQRGALETFAKYWDMMLKPSYGRIGAIGVTNILIVDVIGPFTEVASYFLVPLLWLLDLLSIEYFLALTAVIFAFGVAISVGSLVLEELELRRFPRARDLFVLMLAAILENFGYRQLNNFWRIRGYWQYFYGKGSWGKMTRKGFKES